MLSPPIQARMSAGLLLCRFRLMAVSSWVWATACPEVGISQPSFPSVPLPHCCLSFGGVDTDVPFGTEHSLSEVILSTFDQPWALIRAHWEKEAALAKIERSTEPIILIFRSIYFYNRKYLEGYLVTCPFNITIVVGSPLGLMTSLTRAFHHFHSTGCEFPSKEQAPCKFIIEGSLAGV